MSPFNGDSDNTWLKGEVSVPFNAVYLSFPVEEREFNYLFSDIDVGQFSALQRGFFCIEGREFGSLQRDSSVLKSMKTSGICYTSAYIYLSVTLVQTWQNH